MTGTSKNEQMVKPAGRLDYRGRGESEDEGRVEAMEQLEEEEVGVGCWRTDVGSYAVCIMDGWLAGWWVTDA